MPSVEPIETNINPYLQEDEPTIGPLEELIEVQVDPNEPSRVVFEEEPGCVHLDS